VLRLNGQSITDGAISDIAQLRQLTWLDLNYAAITDEGLRRLKTELPNCRISRVPPIKHRATFFEKLFIVAQNFRPLVRFAMDIEGATQRAAPQSSAASGK
jgi:hypothetical protein